MIYNEKEFIKAVEQSFEKYKEKGARSTEKLKPLHKFVADTLATIWSEGFKLHYMGDQNKEMKVEGKYYPKKIDITITKDDNLVLCIGIKFVTSNFKQNANNYFEKMMGETANIQVKGLPYAQLLVLQHKTPYYKRNETKVSSKKETTNDKDISKYQKLISDTSQVYCPKYLGIQLVDINERTKKVSLTNLENSFSEKIAQLLKSKLSLINFFDEINTYKNYLTIEQ
jgi:hypothetical protein